jgi:hypothetical protein
MSPEDIMEMIRAFADQILTVSKAHNAITTERYMEIQTKILQILSDYDVMPFTGTMILLQGACSMFEASEDLKSDIMRERLEQDSTELTPFQMFDPPDTVQ